MAVPFGGIALLTVFVFFKPPKRASTGLSLKEKMANLDLPGAFFLICAIVCLLLALQWGGTTYAWSDSKVWGCLLGFGLILCVFVALQLRRGERYGFCASTVASHLTSDRATIPPRIITQRTVAAGCAFTALLSMGLYTYASALPPTAPPG